MKKFDYSFLDNGLLPANLINITGTIYSLKAGAKIRQDEYEKIFTELEKIAIVQSVKSSNAIEGIISSDERIKEIVNQNSKPLNHNEKEIAGYRDVLNEIRLHYEDIEFNEDTINNLIKDLMEKEDKNVVEGVNGIDNTESSQKNEEKVDFKEKNRQKEKRTEAGH